MTVHRTKTTTETARTKVGIYDVQLTSKNGESPEFALYDARETGYGERRLYLGLNASQVRELYEFLKGELS